MNILVTGGAGFIGSHIAEYYAKKGHVVEIFDNLSRFRLFRKTGFKPDHNFEYLRNNYKNIKTTKGDIRNQSQLVKACKDKQLIIHAAAQTAVTTSLTDPKTDFSVNATGTLNVLEAARRSNMNPCIIHCSTNKVYGNNINKIIRFRERETRYEFEKKFALGIDETFPTDLCEHTPYGCSKFTGDIYMQDYAQLYGLKTGVFRMSCIYGPRQFGVEDQGWVAWFIIATITGKPLTVYGDGKQVRDILYISDLLDAYDAFVRSKLRHEVFNIGGGPENAISILELLAVIEKLTAIRTNPKFSAWRPGDQKVYISNISKLKSKLGWKPKITMEEGLKKVVKWVCENKHLFRSV